MIAAARVIVGARLSRAGNLVARTMRPSPVRSHFLFRANHSYWATQLVGWGTFTGLFLVWNYVNDTLSNEVLKLLLLVFLTGIATSHLLRAIILRYDWLPGDLGFVLPRLVLASLLLGIVAFFALGSVHDAWLTDMPPLLRVSASELFARVLNWTLLLFLWSLCYMAHNYFVRHRREEIRNLRLETANRENQLNNLRAQMNPHFMFNALNGIRALIDEDPEQAKRAITQLSAILRNAMSTVKRKVVPLGEEIDIVKAYLALEAMRYEERLRTQFDVDPSLEREPVPPMVLQTLVENAVRHGIATLPGGGDVLIEVRRDKGDLLLCVRNSGHYAPSNGPRPAREGGIGLRNTRKRLEMLYGGAGGLSISNRDGMVVTEVRIPASAGTRTNTNISTGP